MRDIAVLGTGYVGLVVSAGLAEFGHRVTAADIDEGRIARLRKGEVPIYEPGLKEYLERHGQEGRIAFSSSVGDAVRRAGVVFVAVGTPSAEDGSADLSALQDALETIAAESTGYKVVVLKSTVPVGTARWAAGILRARGAGRISVVSNPEFLREGRAMEDFLRPDKVVIGYVDARAREIMADVYQPLLRDGRRFVWCLNETAELSKYANNALLATKIAFVNQIAELCDAVGADVRTISTTLGMDHRIGSEFLEPGPGFGGSCFPKDLRALVHAGNAAGVPMRLVEEVLESNEAHIQSVVESVEARCGAVSGAVVGILGLAFKAETDDVRDSPAIAVARNLMGRGAAVRAFDPKANANAARVLGPDVVICADEYETARGADILLLMTEWKRFRDLDLGRVRAAMRGSRVFDTRNLLDPLRVREAGLTYMGMGVPADSPAHQPKREEVA